MRLLIAPDAFKGSLRADEAARAIADGWARARPQHELLLRPLSDGGPGFVRAMAAAHDVPVRESDAMHSLGTVVSVQWCLQTDTAYLEAAQVVGIDRGTDVEHAGSGGLATVIIGALEAGARRIVIGLGGTNVNDAGAGMLAGLGATATDVAGQPVSLTAGPLPLQQVATVDLEACFARFVGIDLVAASDVDVPLLGPRGATYGFAPQKGASEELLPTLEQAVASFAAACGRRPDGKDAAVMLGAGAAGGLGFALLRMGGRRASGIDVVWDESGIDLDGIDLVITGEGRLDWQSMRGKSVSGAARRAQERGIPIIAIAGQVDITPRERSEMGLDAAYSLAEMVGLDRALGEPAEALADAAARLTRTWG